MSLGQPPGLLDSVSAMRLRTKPLEQFKNSAVSAIVRRVLPSNICRVNKDGSVMVTRFLRFVKVEDRS